MGYGYYNQENIIMKNNNKKLTVSIGIPAYFAEKNIKALLESLVTQHEKNQIIQEIIVYSDGCTDKTVKESRSVKDKRIKVIDAKKRRGMIQGLFRMFKVYKGDVFVLLNDDIKITDNNFIDNLILPMKKNKEVGLVGGTPTPLPPRTFVEKATVSAWSVYDISRYKFRNGENKYTCDGKVMALSRSFIKKIDTNLPSEAYGCVDVYIYFSAISNGFDYKYARNAIVYFRAPENIRDFISLTARNNSNIYILEKRFGDIVNREYSIPKKYLYKEKIKELIKNPIPSIAVFFLGQYCNYLAIKKAKNFKVNWDVVTSTKNLN